MRSFSTNQEGMVLGPGVSARTEVNHATTVVQQDDEDKQQVEENGWNHKEVGGNQVFRMVL